MQVDVALYVVYRKTPVSELDFLIKVQATDLLRQYQQTCGFCKYFKNTFYRKNPGNCSVLAAQLNSVFPIIVSARRLHLTGDVTNCYPFIQVRWNDHLENIPLMHCYRINTNILHLTFSSAEF